MNFIICQSCETVVFKNISNKSTQVITTHDLYGHSWDSTQRYEKIALKCNTFYCYTLRCRFALEDLSPYTVQFKMHIPERNNMLPPQKSIKYWVNLIVLAGRYKMFMKTCQRGRQPCKGRIYFNSKSNWLLTRLAFGSGVFLM